MSVARVQTVKKSQKDQGSCEKCGKPLPKGSAYRWFVVGFRSKWKRVRCMDAACTPKPSERESSSKAGLMAVVEGFEETTYDTVEDLRDGWQEVVDAFEEYASERESALEQWEYGNSQLEELASEAREAADDVAYWEPEEYSTELDEDADDFEEQDADALAAWVSEQHSEAIDKANEYL